MLFFKKKTFNSLTGNKIVLQRAGPHNEVRSMVKQNNSFHQEVVVVVQAQQINGC
jgi:hypothetical protein